MPPRDPEFAGDRTAPAPSPPPDAIAYCQRLVANPFLALALLFATFALAAHFSRIEHFHRFRFAPLVDAAVLFLGLTASYFALQYHCLDCGATGTVHRWRRHACPKVRERWNRGFSAWSRLRPTLRTQVALWYLVLFASAIFAALRNA